MLSRQPVCAWQQCMQHEQPVQPVHVFERDGACDVISAMRCAVRAENGNGHFM
jgi:hypothetical protein